MPALHTFIRESERKIEQDVIHWIGNREYSLVQATLKNLSGAEITIKNPIGYPLKVSGNFVVPVIATDEANVTMLLAGGVQTKYVTLANNGTLPVLVLKRGPAIIKTSGIPTKDYADADFDVDAIKAALAALGVPIMTVEDGANATTTEGM